ncbi:hypothetical protein ACFCV3_21865 [Kribbella sp. NPDC056345]|uniref:hypothetical protein n=1 Tax=Kribbella sp. NPDC056345 TaxID=3345789 RepID=UPI0035D5CAF3
MTVVRSWTSVGFVQPRRPAPARVVATLQVSPESVDRRISRLKFPLRSRLPSGRPSTIAMTTPVPGTAKIEGIRHEW